MNRILFLWIMTLVVAGCGGKETIASKSAAAFREAQKQGKTLGPAEHGHGALTPSDSSDAADHEAMGHTKSAQTDQAAMGHQTGAQVDHASMGHAASTGGTATGMDHSRMGHATPSTKMPSGAHAGHAMPRTEQTQTRDHAGHAMPPQIAQTPTDAHAGHSMPGQQGATSAPLGSRVAQAEPGQPAATLTADSLDAPASTSLTDSARSAEMARQMAAGAHAMHGSTNYRHVDAGRVGPAQKNGTVPPASTSSQQEHQHVPPPTEKP